MRSKSIELAISGFRLGSCLLIILALVTRVLCVDRFRMAEAAVVVVGRTGPFGRNHRRPQGPLRRALFAECRTIVRFAYSLQDETADAGVGLEHLQLMYRKSQFGIKLGIFRPQPEAA